MCPLNPFLFLNAALPLLSTPPRLFSLPATSSGAAVGSAAMDLELERAVVEKEVEKIEAHREVNPRWTRESPPFITAWAAFKDKKIQACQEAVSVFRLLSCTEHCVGLCVRSLIFTSDPSSSTWAGGEAGQGDACL